MLLLALAALSAASFAQMSAAGVCNSAYESCISDCCSECGSTTEHNAKGDLVCNVGTASSPNQKCINACTPCSTTYQSCMSSMGASASGSQYAGGSNQSAGCCGSLFVLLGVLGIAGYARLRN